MTYLIELDPVQCYLYGIIDNLILEAMCEVEPHWEVEDDKIRAKIYGVISLITPFYECIGWSRAWYRVSLGCIYKGCQRIMRVTKP